MGSHEAGRPRKPGFTGLSRAGCAATFCVRLGTPKCVLCVPRLAVSPQSPTADRQRFSGLMSGGSAGHWSAQLLLASVRSGALKGLHEIYRRGWDGLT